MSLAVSQYVPAGWIAGLVLAAGWGASLCSSVAVAEAESYSYTGTEQTYTVPAGVSSLQITAIGAAGGSPPAGSGVPGGRGAGVTGVVAVSPGQVLYVSVGGVGGLPTGGFNGGGDGGTLPETTSWGGGGASAVSTVPASAGAVSLQSRLIVAAGGGGSAGIAAGGGDAGAPGGCCGAAGGGPNAAQPGSQTAGGAGGGCATLVAGCGGDGSLGAGGRGGTSGTPPNARSGGGGGGGLFGGGGGAGHVSDIGGGAGGASKVPAGGTIALAPVTTAARIDIDPYIPPPPPQRCADGVDNDGDGLIDFPADPGCASAADDDEAGGAALGGATPGSLLQHMAVTLSFSFNAKRASTRFMRLQIRGVPAGATVHVTCAPKRCPKGLTKHGYTKTNAPAVVSLAQFVKKPLMAKTIITAVISKPGFITTVKRLEVRRSKAPRVTTSCQTPGTPAATPC